MTRKLLVFMLALLLSVFMIFILYLNLLFPSLYAEEVHVTNIELIKDVQKSECTPNLNMNMYFKITIEKGKENINLCTSYSELDVEIKSQDIVNFVDKLNNVNSFDELKNIKFDEEFSQIFSENSFSEDILSFNVVQSLDYDDFSNNYEYKYIDDNNLIIYNYFNTKENNYYNYLMLTFDEDSIYLTYFPAVISNLQSISSVLYDSAIMFILLIVIIIIVAIGVFNKNLKNPINKIISAIKSNNYKNLKINTNDELELLAKTLIKFSTKQQELLEISNQQNRDKEAFLLASAHELKTPVANSKLLVDSMIEEVGRYKDTKKHLPLVNKELARVQNIINDLLSIVITDSKCDEEVEICTLINNLIDSKQIIIEEKNIRFNVTCFENSIITNQKMFEVIIDNVITNAVNYADSESEVEIVFNNNILIITNYCSAIKHYDISRISEPFVKHNMENSGHGLGLYITKYYANALNYKIVFDKQEILFKVTIDIGGCDDTYK